MNKLLLLLITFFTIVSAKSQFTLPEHIEAGFKYRCYQCEILSAGKHYEGYYSIEYKQGHKTQIAGLDLNGRWIKHYELIDFDSIPKNIISVFNIEKAKLDSVYDNHPVIKIHKDFINMNFELWGIPTIEYSEISTEGYYKIEIIRPVGYFPSFNDQGESIEETNYETENIKISRKGKVMNKMKVLEHKIVGKPLGGIPYFINKPEEYKNYTSITEYSKGYATDGMQIQYFKYPDSIATVDYYEKNHPKGAFYDFHKNGQIKSLGYHKCGKVIITHRWTEDGFPHLKTCKYDSLNKVFYDGNGNLIDGLKILQNAKVYFTKGKLDSADRGGYIDNYCDNTFRQSIPQSNQIGYCTFDLIDYSITHEEGFAKYNFKSQISNKAYLKIYFTNKKEKLESEGYMEKFKKTGKWKYYNEKGKLIKKEKF